MKFGVPRIWSEPTDHLKNCYFRKIVVNGHHRGKKRDIFNYPDLPSSLPPVKHCQELTVPNCPASVSRDSSSSETDIDILYDLSSIEIEPHFPNQSELNDLIRDLG